VISFDGSMQRQEFYELRRHKTVKSITGEGVWLWHYAMPNKSHTCTETLFSSPHADCAYNWTNRLTTEQRTLLGVLGATIQGIAEGRERARIYGLDEVWHLTRPLCIASTPHALHVIVQRLSSRTHKPLPDPIIDAMNKIFRIVERPPDVPLVLFTPRADHTMGRTLIEYGMSGMPTLSELEIARLR